MGNVRFACLIALASFAGCLETGDPTRSDPADEVGEAQARVAVPPAPGPEATPDQDKATQLGSNWCCRARTVIEPDHWTCWGMHTLGALAAAKCGVFFAGVPIVEGIRLSKQTCGSVPECM